MPELVGNESDRHEWEVRVAAANWHGDPDALVDVLERAGTERFVTPMKPGRVRALVAYAERKWKPTTGRRTTLSAARGRIRRWLRDLRVRWDDVDTCNDLLTLMTFAQVGLQARDTATRIDMSARDLLECRGPLPALRAERVSIEADRRRVWRHAKTLATESRLLTMGTAGSWKHATSWTFRPEPLSADAVTYPETGREGSLIEPYSICDADGGPQGQSRTVWWHRLEGDRLPSASDQFWGRDPRLVLFWGFLQGFPCAVSQGAARAGCSEVVARGLLLQLLELGLVTERDGVFIVCGFESLTWEKWEQARALHAGERASYLNAIQTLDAMTVSDAEAPTDVEDVVVVVTEPQIMLDPPADVLVASAIVLDDDEHGIPETRVGMVWHWPTTDPPDWPFDAVDEREPGADDDDTTPTWWREVAA